MMAAKRGPRPMARRFLLPARRRKARATSSFTKARSAHTSGMTAPNIRGSSNASGISSRRSPIPIRFTPGLKMPLCFKARTRARPGRNCPVCANSDADNLWQPGAGGMCLHTILLDPGNPQRIFVAISAAGAFRTDDGGKTWKPINRGLKSAYELPDPNCRSRPLRASDRHASFASERALHAEALGCHAQRRCRRHRGTK